MRHDVRRSQCIWGEIINHYVIPFLFLRKRQNNGSQSLGAAFVTADNITRNTSQSRPWDSVFVVPKDVSVNVQNITVGGKDVRSQLESHHSSHSQLTSVLISHTKFKFQARSKIQILQNVVTFQADNRKTKAEGRCSS